MTSHAEPTPKATCRATTRAGKPCRKQAVADGLCTFHSGAIDLAEAGRKGGRARGARKPEQRGDQLESLAHTALEEMLRSSSGSATARAAAVRIALSSAAPYGAELGKKAAVAELQARMEDEL
jgi:hypothetical protein